MCICVCIYIIYIYICIYIYIYILYAYAINEFICMHFLCVYMTIMESGHQGHNKDGGMFWGTKVHAGSTHGSSG